MSTNLARQRLSQLFNFFKAVEDRRTPRITAVKDHRWFLWLDDLPAHVSCRLHRPCPDDGEWLSLKKPDLTACPAPPAPLHGWLIDGWESPQAERPSVHAERTLRQGEEFKSETFGASEQRSRSFEEWMEHRALWRSVELPARKLAQIWDRIFSLHNDLQRDGENWDLVLGDGLFSYMDGATFIYHPIVLRKVEHSFNPATREFKFTSSDARPELYSPAFASAQFAGLPIKKWAESLEREDLHPLDGENLDYWLKGLAGSIKDGNFLEAMPEEQSRRPLFGRGAVLFLRSRATGKSQFIDEILGHLPTAEIFPASLMRIVGISPPPETVDEEDVHGAYANEQTDVLLTKPANAEQVAILRRLAKRDGVLVQGPPGTGKTHTIANLIGSFLSEGKSVLVTSHTTKALRVVRDQVADPLRSLCVSMLDSDAQSRLERELAIRELGSRLSDNPDQYRFEAKKLRNQRDVLIGQLQVARAELLTAVQGEYVPIVLSGQEIDPVQAAKVVANGADIHSWLLGPIHPTAPAPFSDSELKLLQQSGNALTQQDEAELAEALPELRELPSIEQFSGWVATYRELSQADLEFRKELWVSTNNNPDLSLESLHQTLKQVFQQLQQLGAHPWKLAVIQAGMEAGQAKLIWQLLCKKIDEVRQKGQSVARALFEYGPELAYDLPIDGQLRVLKEINAHLKSDSEVSWWRLKLAPSWKLHIDRWRVNGKPPKFSDDFLALHDVAELAIARQTLRDQWSRVMVPLGVTSLAAVDIPPEDYSLQYVGQIQTMLAWYESTWQPIESELVAQGLAWAQLLSEAPPATTVHHLAERLRHTVENALPDVVTAEVRRRQLAALNLRFKLVEDDLAAIQGRRSQESLAVRGVLEAIKSRSQAAYATAWQRLGTLLGLRVHYNLRCELLVRLKPIALAWFTALSSRHAGAIPDRPELSFHMAWQWLQLRQELDRRAALSPHAIQERIRQLSDQLRTTTIHLVEQLAWAGLLQKVTADQRQALLGWAQTMKRVGAGTGKLAKGLLRQARQEMEKARGAVPVWIMPFSQVTSNFHPVRDKFDVLIIDEASQEDVLGIVPFYLAHKVIVVGDDEQVTPLDVGGLQAPIQDLIGQWLDGMPSQMLFDLKTSVYDRAQIAFGSVIRLKEHFRCVPEIIQFSNATCYNYTIKPLREAASTSLKPALVPHRVQGDVIDKVNRAEALEIASLIQACLESPAYDGKSFGVITMVGDKQADAISDLLRSQIDPTVYEQRRILCGNPAQFQGDERDVIFLSLVDSKNDGVGPLSMRQDGTDGMWKKRFNVAASRAKDQLWVVYSIDHQTQLKPGDIRRRLIEHALDPSGLMDRLHEGLRLTESPFEAEVLTLLTAQGYKVQPQWPVGAYRIDLVVEGNGKRLAVECDGERWHYDKVEEDLARQALLERLGWTFVRLRGSTFYRDRTPHRAVAMQPVFEKLEEFGILPVGADCYETSPLPEVIDSIRRRAHAIRHPVTEEAPASWADA